MKRLLLFCVSKVLILKPNSKAIQIKVLMWFYLNFGK